MAADLDAQVGVVLENLDRRVEQWLGLRANVRLAGGEENALDDPGELLDLLREIVRAAVGILEPVERLRIVGTLVVGREDAVVVHVADRAAIGLDPRLVRAAVVRIEEAVAVGVWNRAAVGFDARLLRTRVDIVGKAVVVAVAHRTAVGGNADLVDASVLVVEEAVAVGVGRNDDRLGLLARAQQHREPEQELERVGGVVDGAAALGRHDVPNVQSQLDAVVDEILDAATDGERLVAVVADRIVFGVDRQPAAAEHRERNDAVQTKLQHDVGSHRADEGALVGHGARWHHRDLALEAEVAQRVVPNACTQLARAGGVLLERKIAEVQLEVVRRHPQAAEDADLEHVASRGDALDPGTGRLGVALAVRIATGAEVDTRLGLCGACSQGRARRAQQAERNEGGRIAKIRDGHRPTRSGTPG